MALIVKGWHGIRCTLPRIKKNLKGAKIDKAIFSGQNINICMDVYETINKKLYKTCNSMAFLTEIQTFFYHAVHFVHCCANYV